MSGGAERRPFQGRRSRHLFESLSLRGLSCLSIMRSESQKNAEQLPQFFKLCITTNFTPVLNSD